jgi:hypothetical protein
MVVEIVALLAVLPATHDDLRKPETLTALVELLLTSETVTLQEHVTTAIAAVDLSEEEARIVHNLGGQLALVNLLQIGSKPTVMACLVCLANLARYSVCRGSIVEAGGVGHVLNLLSSETEPLEMKERATECLYMLSPDPGAAAAVDAVKTGFAIVVGLVTAAKNVRQKERAVSVLVDLCEQKESDWEEFKQLASLPGLLLLATSCNIRAQHRVGQELSVMSSDRGTS